LAATYLVTREQIEMEQQKAAEKALFELVPQSAHDNNMLSDVIPLTAEAKQSLGLKSEGQIHLARKDGERVAYIYPSTAADGYSGDIHMIIGVNVDGTLAGVRVLGHKETPGLGDKLDLKKSNWILGFQGKSLTEPEADQWKVKKDGGYFDQFTGATITPRAVVKRVKSTLEFHNETMDQL